MSISQKRKFSKTISLLTCVSLFALVSCQSAQTVSDVTSDDSSATQTSAEDVSDVLKPEFESTDYNGEEFHILAPTWGLYQLYFFADEQTGEPMNDAIYERKMRVEDYLGVNITYDNDSTAIYEIMGKVQTSVMAGDDAYQLVLTHCIHGVSSMVTSGLLYDWNDLVYCNLDKSYWNQNCNESLSINGHQYYAVSDFMLPDPNCILFSKDMVESHSLENPYELVRNGGWTLDKFIEMSSKVTVDLDGNSVYDFNDQYGLGSPNDWYWNSFLYSSNIYLVSKDKDGSFELAINNNRTVDLIEKLDRFVNGANDTYIYSHTLGEDERLKISSGRILFQIEAVQRLNLLRDSEVEFGILPYPKYDEAQDDYYSNDWSGLMCVPKTVSNPDMVGQVCELLALYSGETTIPAYFDLMLGEKLSRDDDSKEMLNIIFDNIVFDPGLNYFGFSTNTMKLFYTIPNLVLKQGSSTFASWYAQYGSGAEAEIEEFMTDVAKLNG